MKTAVEWLIEQWPILESQLPQYLIEQAKEMEKEQIVKAYESPACFTPCDDGCYREKTGEQYYNETFKSE